MNVAAGYFDRMQISTKPARWRKPAWGRKSRGNPMLGCRVEIPIFQKFEDIAKRRKVGVAVVVREACTNFLRGIGADISTTSETLLDTATAPVAAQPVRKKVWEGTGAAEKPATLQRAAERRGEGAVLVDSKRST